MTIMTPSPSLAWDIPNVEGPVGNLTVATFLAASIEESSFHASSMIPGAEWFNQYIGAPVALGGSIVCSAGAAICQSCG